MIDNSSYSVSRINKGNYQIHWRSFPEGKIRVAVADSPRNVLNGEFICEVEFDAASGGASLVIPDTHGVAFFHFRSPEGEETLITDRLLPLQSASNFRDFGGYHTIDGKRLRWQMLYHSGHLGTLTENDKKLIADLDIGLVCDFRTSREIEMHPSRFDKRHQPIILTLQLDPGDNIGFVEWVKTNPDPEELDRTIVQNYHAINRQLAIDNAPVYRKMFFALLESECPALIHCTAGKDRTGVGAALILSLLGVPEQTILEDYLLTNEYIDTQQALRWYSNLIGIKLDSRIADSLFGVREHYLQSAFDSIRKEFGTMENYFREAMQLDSEAVRTFQKRFLD